MGASDDIRAGVRDVIDILAPTTSLSFSATVGGAYVAFVGVINYDRSVPDTEDDGFSQFADTATLHVSDAVVAISVDGFVQDSQAQKWLVATKSLAAQGTKTYGLVRKDVSSLGLQRGEAE